MADYIRRKSAYNKLNDIGGCGANPESWADGWDKAINEAISIIENIPSENVVPVVRCKDCKYCSSYYDSDRYCDMFDFEPPSDDFYCRDGERKDDE